MARYVKFLIILNHVFSIFAAPKATVILRGKVDSRNEEAIRKALMKIIHDFTPIKGELYLEMEKEVYKTQEGYTSYSNHLLVLFFHMIYEVIVCVL